jgi:hypothetical protein
MDGVAGWFEKRGEIPLVPPPRIREYEPLGDDPDPPHADFSDESIRGVAFGIEYCDQRGWLSRRTIRCLALDPRPPACIKAYCNVCGTTRAFRADRIVSVIDLRSGRMLASDEHVAILAPYLPQYDADPTAAVMRRLQQVSRPGVFALLQFAMIGGRLGEIERQILLDYVAAEAANSGLPFPADRVELWIDNLAPTLDAVVAAIGDLLATKAGFARLLPRLLKLVRAREGARQEDSITELFAEIREHYRRKLRDWPSERARAAAGLSSA